MRSVSQAFEDRVRNWAAAAFRFYLYLFEGRPVVYGSQTDWEDGSTAAGGTADLSGSRTVDTMKPWQAPDGTLRSPEYVGKLVTDSGYSAAIGTPDPGPTDTRGLAVTAATSSIDTSAAVAADSMGPKLFLRTLSDNTGRMLGTDVNDLTNWTEGNNGGTGSISATSPGLRVTEEAAVAGAEKSRWAVRNQAKNYNGAWLSVKVTVPAPSTDYEIGSIVLSKTKNTSGDPLDDAGGKTGIEIGCKANPGSGNYEWFITQWEAGVANPLTLAANPNVTAKYVVVHLVDGGAGADTLLVRVDGTVLFSGTIADLTTHTFYLNAVMRSARTGGGRHVDFAKFRVCDSSVLSFANLEENMVAQVRTQAGAVLLSDAADGSGDASVDLDSLTGADNPFDKGLLPLECRLAVLDTDGSTLILQSQPLGAYANNDVDTTLGGVYGGDTIRFAQPNTVEDGTLEYAVAWDGAYWRSPILDSQHRTGWDRVSEWYRAARRDTMSDLVWDADDELRAECLLFDSLESAETVRANGGAMAGGTFRQGIHGRAAFFRPGQFATFPPAAISAGGGFASFWFALYRAGEPLAVSDWAGSDDVTLLRTVGGTGYIKVKITPWSKSITLTVHDGMTPHSANFAIDNSLLSETWLHVAVGWADSFATGINVTVNGIQRARYTVPSFSWPGDHTSLRIGENAPANGTTPTTVDYEVAIDQLLIRSDTPSFSNPSLYSRVATRVEVAVADTISDLEDASYESVEPSAPRWLLPSPPSGRFARLRLVFPQAQQFMLGDTSYTLQATLPYLVSVRSLEFEPRLRLGGHALTRRGSISRRLEEPGTIGIFPTGGYQYAAGINNEDGAWNANVLDSILNNTRILGSRMRVACGFALDDDTEELLDQGIFYVENEAPGGLSREIVVSGSDLWSKIADTDLVEGLSTLAADLTSGATTSMTLVDNPQTAGFPSPGTYYVFIEGEIIKYTDWDPGAKLLKTLTRGQFNTVAAAHKQGTPVKVCWANSPVDALIAQITSDLGLAAGEIELPGHDGPEWLVLTDRRAIQRMSGVATDEPMLGSVDTGLGLGQIGAPVASPMGVVGSFSVGRAPTSLSPTPPLDLYAIAQMTSAGSGSGLVDGDRLINVVLRTQVGPLAPAAQEANVNIEPNPPASPNPFVTKGNRPGQVAVRYVSAATDASGAFTTYEVHLYGAKQDASGVDTFWVHRLRLHQNASTGLVYLGGDATVEQTLAWGAAPLSAGSTTGPGCFSWDEAGGQLTYLTNEDGRIRIYTVDLPDLGTIPLANPTITLKATLNGYDNATGFCAIGASENPLGNSEKRFVLACRRESDGLVCLVTLDDAYAVVEDADCADPVLGLGFIQSFTRIFGPATPSSYLFGGKGRGSQGQDVVTTWDPETGGNLPVGVVAIYDLFFQHPLVKASPTPTFELNGSTWSSAEYLVDLNGSIPKISFEKLLTVADQVTATYEYKTSAGYAQFAGMKASDALQAAAAIALMAVYFREDEQFVARVKGAASPAAFAFQTRAQGPSGASMVEDVDGPRYDLRALRNRMQLTIGNPYDPNAKTVIYRDVSSIQPSSTDYLNTIDLYGFRDLSGVENVWILSNADALAMIDLFLAYYDLKATATVRSVLVPMLELMDASTLHDHLHGIGYGAAARPVGSGFQILSLSRDYDALVQSTELREL